MELGHRPTLPRRPSLRLARRSIISASSTDVYHCIALHPPWRPSAVCARSAAGASETVRSGNTTIPRRGFICTSLAAEG